MIDIILFALFLLSASATFASEYYSERTVWDRPGGGQLNISAFAFRDVNRNSIYDMADQPMAGIVFELAGGGRTVTRRTNRSGFENFVMSVLDRNQDIVSRGKYTFLAMIPHGWLLTTGNASQTASFELMPGAPADMISSNPPRPVGLAQELTIRGKISGSTEGAAAVRPSTLRAVGQTRVHAISPAGERQRIAVDQAGSFSFAAIPGNWTVVAEGGAGGTPSERRVEVAATPVLLATLVPGEARHEAVERSTVGFDDLISAGIKEIPSGYGGLNWQNWAVAHQKFYDGDGYVNTTMSGEFIAYNSSGHPVKITRDQPFDFVGGYFGSAWMQAEGETLRIKGWRGDVIAYEEDIKLSALGPIYFFADFHNVTMIEFSTQRYWQFVGDDLQFYLPN